jgi:hypothetical protein
VATVVRLLPRHWDGRRLLQFLTGLALIALAFAAPTLQGPVGPAAEAPVQIITTVDTPRGPGLPVIDGPVESDPVTDGPVESGPGLGRTGLALEADAAAEAAAVADATSPLDASGTSAAQSGTAQSGTAQSGTAQPATAQPATAQPATVRSVPVQPRPAGRRICADVHVAAGGPAQRAHSERGPPRA